MKSRTSALVLFAAIVISGAVFCYKNLSKLIEERSWVEHTVSVLIEIGSTDSWLSQADAQVSRFLITGDQQYVGDYREAISNVRFHVGRLQTLCSDDHDQQVALRNLDQQLRELMQGFDREIDHGDRREYPADILALTRSTRALLTKLREEQNQLLQIRSSQVARSASLARLGLIVATGLDFVFLLVLGVITQLDMGQSRQLAESHRLLTSVLDSTQDAIIGKTLDGTITTWNQGAQGIYGYTEDEIVGKSIYSLAPEERAAEMTEILHKIKQGESITQYESVQRTKDGRLLNVFLTVSPIRNREGQIVAACTVARDITAQRQAEQGLRSSEQQYRLLFQSHPLPMWVFDRSTMQFLAVNEAAIRHYGYSRDEFLNMTILDIRPVEDVPALLKTLRDPTMGLGKTALSRHRKKDGSLIDVEVTSHSLAFQGRKAELVLANDVTERRQSEERLRQSEERFSKAFRASPLAITISTMAEGRYVDVNPAFLQLVGYSRDELIGRTAEELHIWVEQQDLQIMVQGLTDRSPVGGVTTRLRTKSGDTRLTRVSADYIELEGASCVLAITRDMSEEKRLENQLRQAQKMEAVGRLAGGIAHDFNNILGVIIGYSELAQEELDSASSARDHVAQIRDAGQRAASLTSQLLAFSRQQILQPRVLNLNAVVNNLLPMLRRMIAENIELIFQPYPQLGSVKADQGQIEQVLMNLAVNARDAMPGGGKLVFETANTELDESYAKDHVPVRPGSYVLLSVADTGSGMDASTASRIFEPFFTTKELGKGTGLGLSIVYGVVKQSGGYIWVYSEPGKGTAFKIYLPRVDEVAEILEPGGAQILKTTGSETILLVEDDEPLRKLTRSLLEANGYKVLEAENGPRAILIAEQSTTIDLLLTDVVMPGTSGSELTAKVKLSHPDLKVLFISGYSGELIAHHGVLEKGTNLLQKPFTRSSLLTNVRSVLDSS